MHTEQVIRTPGKPPTFVQPRPDGGWLIRQGKNGRNTVRLAEDETAMLIAILSAAK
ncbi:hypothetical protein [Mycolicibacterium fortuitum]